MFYKKNHFPVFLIFFISFFSFSLANAIEIPKNLKLSDSVKACVSCHKNYIEEWLPTKHAMIFFNNPRNELEERACEACHGDGKAHIVDSKAKARTDEKIDLSLIRSFTKESKLPASEKNAPCIGCHKSYVATFWMGSSHERNNISCVDCHQIIRKIKPIKKRGKDKRVLSEKINLKTELCVTCHVQRRAQMQRSSHMPLRFGKLDCVSCHNPHGDKGPAQLRQATVNENCYSCHAEKRGPMLWEHPPVRENCNNCHDSHGSNNTKLLKQKSPYLCQSCHSAPYHPGTIYEGASLANASKQMVGRGCLNCHTMQHGSNHPSGARLTR
ncbi:MAG: DmsE family decaheme c-type cytochrome [Nitrospinae bacterium]|nr:DmsE family decaheme c-type cytochrome [Nitrospinota bacterium]